MRSAPEQDRLEQALRAAAERVDGGFEMERAEILRYNGDAEQSFAEIEDALRELNDGLPLSAAGDRLERRLVAALDTHEKRLRQLRRQVEDASSAGLLEPVRAIEADVRVGEL